MRIIKFLFKSLLLVAIVGGIGFLLAREALLFAGVGKIKSSLSTLKKTSVQKTYFTKCREKGSVFIDGDDQAVIQLRFTSSDEYVLEVLCSQISIDPIVLGKEKLPMFVRKIAGKSGIIWGDTRSGISLEVFNKQKSIGVEDRLVVTFSADSELGIEPNTSCSGYGFSCCRYESEQGLGEQFNNSIDCPKTCFSSCQSRPVVLSLNTQPLLDLEKRQVIVSAGESVIFSYVIDVGFDSYASVNFSYGDGKVDTFYMDKQTFEHTYQCSKRECRYEVKLSVENNLGIPAVDLPVMNMVVLVRG